MNIINTYLEADGPIKCFDVYFWLFLILFTHFRPSRTRIFRMFSRLKNGKKGAIMNINTYLEADVPIICFDVHFWLFLILFTQIRPSWTRIFRMFSMVWSIVRRFRMVFVYQCLRLVKSKWTFMTSSLKIILICNWLKKNHIHLSLYKAEKRGKIHLWRTIIAIPENYFLVFWLLVVCIVSANVSVWPMSFFSYRPIPIKPNKLNFLIGLYR